ncbi:hypothetical protein [Sphingopyxis sp.]|uniref:hypothetical protein n=1 Tax=Sphingopyxis sp. TaxID=1908224 RepID=UPI0026012828|nr:hypothetical protein [Sphingopyxis sp.]MBR2173616.1 hypothetical protein [Sphingopyxis sp.]
MKIAICVIARNEEGSIGPLIAQLARQSLLAQPYAFQILILANACSDDTAGMARAPSTRHSATMGRIS